MSPRLFHFDGDVVFSSDNLPSRLSEGGNGIRRQAEADTNKVPSFIVEKKRISSGSANELRTWPKCNYLGRSAWIYLFSMLDECARRLLRKDKYSDMHNRKRRQRRGRDLYDSPTYFFREGLHACLVRYKNINFAKSHVLWHQMHLRQCNYASVRQERGNINE